MQKFHQTHPALVLFSESTGGARSNVPAGIIMSSLRPADANLISMELQLNRSGLWWRPERDLR